MNFNGRKFLKKCIGSLMGLEYPKSKVEIIMVDNGSSDGSIDYVKDAFANVIIVENKINNYCMANNRGIKEAKGDFVALINNDVVVKKNWLFALVEEMQKDLTNRWGCRKSYVSRWYDTGCRTFMISLAITGQIEDLMSKM